MFVSLEDRTAIGDGVHRFFRLVDSGKASLTASLFTDDAELTFGPGSPSPGTIRGADIARAMIAREAQTTAFTRHIVSNLAFETEAAGIRATYILTLYRSDDDTRQALPAFVADVDELWVSKDAQWRMASRLILPAFSRA